MSPERGYFLADGGSLHLHVDPGDLLFPALEGFEAMSILCTFHHFSGTVWLASDKVFREHATTTCLTVLVVHEPVVI